MKKITLLLTIAIASFHYTYAGTGTVNSMTAKPNSDNLYKTVAAQDVSLDVERADGVVMLHLYSRNMRTTDVIYIDRSIDPTGNFSRCTSIKVTENLIKSKSNIETIDANPASSAHDSYYRIRTLSAKGEVRTYPSVNLSPLYEIEQMEEIAQK